MRWKMRLNALRLHATCPVLRVIFDMLKTTGSLRAIATGGALLAGLGAAAGDTPASTIHRDVAIIGGGASGAYSAVRLREDFGLSVVLVEKEAFLVRRPGRS